VGCIWRPDDISSGSNHIEAWHRRFKGFDCKTSMAIDYLLSKEAQYQISTITNTILLNDRLKDLEEVKFKKRVTFKHYLASKEYQKDVNDMITTYIENNDSNQKQITNQNRKLPQPMINQTHY